MVNKCISFWGIIGIKNVKKFILKKMCIGKFNIIKIYVVLIIINICICRWMYMYIYWFR